jgi:hypothetical protein
MPQQRLFSHRLEIRITKRQAQALTRLSSALERPVAELVRFCITSGTAALEEAHAQVIEEMFGCPSTPGS